MKFVFTPVSLLAGLLAGLVGKKIFERLWGLVDDEEPPRPEHREFSWPKLIAALLFRGRNFPLGQGPDRSRSQAVLRHGDRLMARRGRTQAE